MAAQHDTQTGRAPLAMGLLPALCPWLFEEPSALAPVAPPPVEMVPPSPVTASDGVQLYRPPIEVREHGATLGRVGGPVPTLALDTPPVVLRKTAHDRAAEAAQMQVAQVPLSGGTLIDDILAELGLPLVEPHP